MPIAPLPRQPNTEIQHRDDFGKTIVDISDQRVAGEISFSNTNLIVGAHETSPAAPIRRYPVSKDPASFAACSETAAVHLGSMSRHGLMGIQSVVTSLKNLTYVGNPDTRKNPSLETLFRDDPPTDVDIKNIVIEAGKSHSGSNFIESPWASQ